ncbi:MAG: phosphate-starvation-inducible PsiE family protein [Archaeoglobaceae archaeon]
MDIRFDQKLVKLPVKALALIVAFMIVVRFAFVFFDFLQNPFHEPLTLSEEAVRHIMTGLILLELFVLTLQFLVKEIVDANIILITILTVLGRDIIVINVQEVAYTTILAIGFLLAVTITGIYFLGRRDVEECRRKIF